MSNMKNGFSTLNRWLGKKNKDKTALNGKLSKSNTNLSLSVSSTNINETSQLEYNRITPLPAATSNAPFEQTFRITVLLPKEQLYVSRLGARVPLSKLLELVCENKLLDAEKYEFRNPVDPSQVYSCDLTIGAVGLSEIRLCHKSESYDTFNADEVIKLHRTSVIRESLSSSEFSSRNSKHTTKTASPYSSSNSLNSMDSTGMNYTRTPLSLPPPTLPSTTPPAMKAPPRKKRAAPRPPSQTAIPEKSTLVITEKTRSEAAAAAKTTSETSNTSTLLNDTALPRKDYYVSTPNLASPTLLTSDNSSIDCNGNTQANLNNNNNTLAETLTADDVNQLYATVEKKNARNLYRGSVQNLSSLTSSDHAQRLPEPSPRKRLIQIKKKSSAPAPPPRGMASMYTEDSVSIASTTPSTPDTPSAPLTPVTPATPEILTEQEELRPQSREVPKPLERESVAATKPLETSTPVVTESVSTTPLTTSYTETPTNVPKPVPRLTTSTTTTLLNVSASENSNVSEARSTPPASIPQHTNVSKVMLNRTPTPEPRSLSCEPTLPETHNGLMAHIVEQLKTNGTETSEDDDNISKQADSGIGEPVPSPIPDSLPSEGSAHEFKSNFESSSDDDDMIKVYNFKLGKTSVKLDVPKMLEDLAALEAAQTDSGGTTPALTLSHDITPSITDASSWNFTIPISPPPNFADNSKTSEQLVVEKLPDAPITPKIKERPVLNFEAFEASPTDRDIKCDEKVNAKTPYVLDQHCNEKHEPPKFEKDRITQKHTSSPLSSPSTPMSDIVDELSTIIHENRIDSLIRKVEDQNEIEAAKPNTLSNFSITTITNQQQAQTLSSSKPFEMQSLNAAPKSLPSEFLVDEDKLYRKKGNNSNNLREQRKSVTRSDSFHTTTVMQTQTAVNSANTLANLDTSIDGLNSRSSSYLSLTKIEQNGLSLNRRRSSSELSIGESPSLQSLEVMKTILNSRKNSLANSSDGESKTTSFEIINQIEGKRSPTKETKITSVELKPKSIQQPEDVVVETRSKPEITKVEEAAPSVLALSPKQQQVKEIPKVYRYSGPPSINFSTWNERPKGQVSIKNEGDYIFGGKTAGNQNVAVTKAAFEFNINSATTMAPRNYRASTPANTFQPHLKLNQNKEEEEKKALIVNESVLRTTTPTATASTPPAVAPKPTPASPTKRMGIPEQEFHVPLTVKPLPDVTVESVDLNRTTLPAQRENETKTTNRTTVTLNRVASQTSPSQPPADVVEQIKRPLHTVSNTSTLPRASANRFSMPASAATRTNPSLLRSTSITQLEASNQPKASETVAPFGQNTLRKTGLKEKILAKEEAASQKAKMGVIAPSDGNSTKSTTDNSTRNYAQMQNGTATNGNVQIRTTTIQKSDIPNYILKTTQQQQQQHKTLQSTKFELKLQNTTSVYLPQSATTATPNISSSTMVLAPSPPPPPPPSILKNSGATKPKFTNSTSSADPRDQLLAAIRNFKSDELNRT